jgi:uncharacterized protein YndB with AHSA1/START domain
MDVITEAINHFAMLSTPTSTLQFVVVRDIAATPVAVFDALTSPAGMRAWVPMCRSVEWRHPPGRDTLGKDSVRYIVLRGGLVAAERIIAWEEGRELHYTFDESSIPLGAVTTRYVGTTRVESAGSAQTRLSWSIHFDTPGWQRALAPVLRLNLRGFIGLMASNVRRIAEAHAR